MTRQLSTRKLIDYNKSYKASVLAKVGQPAIDAARDRLCINCQLNKKLTCPDLYPLTGSGEDCSYFKAI